VPSELGEWELSKLPVPGSRGTPCKCNCSRTSAEFDDRYLVSHARLVPVMALVERAGLPELVAEHIRPAGDWG
jgi:hypothetical protein